MVMTKLRRYSEIAKINLQHNFLSHFLLAMVLLIVTPIIFGVQSLDERAAGVPLEMFVSLIGIVLMVPVFLPEQNDDINDVTASKYISSICVYSIRIIYSIVIMVLMIAGFILYMKASGSAVDTRHLFGTVSTAIFLGGAGTVVYGISKNIVVAYMIPIVYYAINFSGGGMLKKFYLFTMGQGNFENKIWLLAGGVIMILIAIWYKSVARKFL